MSTLREITQTTVGKALIERMAQESDHTETMITAIIMTGGELTQYFLKMVKEIVK